jgi:hypothetical protein
MGLHFLNGSIMEVKMKELSIKDQKSLTGGNQNLDPGFWIGAWLQGVLIGLVGISTKA